MFNGAGAPHMVYSPGDGRRHCVLNFRHCVSLDILKRHALGVSFSGLLKQGDLVLESN